MRALSIFALVYLGLASNLALGQTPGMLGFQGLLKDGSGAPINGTVDLEFRIFDAETAGVLVDMDGDGAVENTCGQDVTCVSTLSVTEGIVSTKFGPIHPKAFNGTQRWLELSVNDGGGLVALSRVEMITAPAASEQVNRPGSGTPAIVVDQDGNVGIGMTSPGTNLQVAGTVQIGDSGKECSSGMDGVLRWDALSKLFFGCDGTSWIPLNHARRFQDMIETYEYPVNNPPLDGDASHWNDECLEGGDALFFGDVGNAEADNWTIFTMKIPVAVSFYYAKTRMHPGANYFGNSKLYGSNDKISWVELAYLGGADGSCIDQGPVVIPSNTRFKYFRVTFYGNGRTTYESLSHIKIGL